jgi:hypothetical protein
MFISCYFVAIFVYDQKDFRHVDHLPFMSGGRKQKRLHVSMEALKTNP